MVVLALRAPAALGRGATLAGALAIGAGWLVLAIDPVHSRAASFAAMWLAMAVAMMVPTTLRPMMRAADGSSRRAFAYAAGFALVWLVAGIPAYLVMNAVAWTPFWIAAAWFVAGMYQTLPAMRRNLRSCGSIRYAHDPLRYGVRQGARCVTSCWPLMIAVMVTAMAIPGTVLPLAALVAATALVCWLKDPSASSRAVASVGIAMLVLAGMAFVLVGGGQPGAPAPHHASAAPVSATSMS